MADWPPLHDYSGSRAVVMGTWDYLYLPPIAAVGNSLERMTGLLTGSLCGWPGDRVLMWPNETGPGDLPDRLITAFEDVTDIALFYYVGHGQIDLDDQLCLGLTGSRTEPNRRAATSLPFSAVRRALLDSSAATKILIRDCCFAGLASRPANSLAGAPSDVLDLTTGTGAYIMAAAGAYTTAWYEAGQGSTRPQTYFTKYLADLVEAGIPGQSPGLRLHPLFSRLRDNLATDYRPVPQERSVDAARDFVFAHNAAPPETHRDPDLEVRRLTERLAEADARERELRAEAAARARELTQLQEAARAAGTAAGQPAALHDAIMAAGSRLEEATAAQAAAAADSAAAEAALADPASAAAVTGREGPSGGGASDEGTSGEPPVRAAGPESADGLARRAIDRLSPRTRIILVGAAGLLIVSAILRVVLVPVPAPARAGDTSSSHSHGSSTPSVHASFTPSVPGRPLAAVHLTGPAPTKPLYPLSYPDAV